MVTKRHITEEDSQDLLSNLPSYSSNAAAIAGGLTVGQFYQLTGVTVGILTLTLITKVQ